MADRIEAGTFMMLAAATRSRLTLTNVRADHLRAVSAKLAEMGVDILEDGNRMVVDARDRELKAVNVTTQSYPGFPTDLQPQMSALLATVPGTSVVQDPVYPDRLTHVAELHRMGYFVLGLDGGGDMSLPQLELATEPLVVVVGSEGKGLSRLVTEHCDAIVSIPIESAMESLNASMAVGITLYEIARRRAGA